MVKTKIVVVSADDTSKITQQQIDYYINEYAKKDVQALIDFKVYTNNKESLGSIYNNELANAKSLIESNSDVQYDWLIFMHADARVDIIELLDSLYSVNDLYDIVGACGCSKISVSASPLNWFTGSQRFPNSRWGKITHGSLGEEQQTYYSVHSPGIKHHAVSCIDGVLMAFSKKAICNSDKLFDPQFKYDMYDTDMSFNAIMNYKFNIGIVVLNSLKHESVGKSILSDNFLNTEIQFRKKWNFEFPNGSKIQAMFNQQQEKLQKICRTDQQS